MGSEGTARPGFVIREFGRGLRMPGKRRASVGGGEKRRVGRKRLAGDGVVAGSAAFVVSARGGATYGNCGGGGRF